MSSKKVRISVDPETFATMSPEAVKACVNRRVEHARAKAPQRRVIALVCFSLTLVLMGVAAFAANTSFVRVDDTPIITPTTGSAIVAIPDDKCWPISEADKATVTTVVMSVARGESRLAMQAVAQAIRNACEAHDLSVSEVVEKYQWPASYQGQPSTDAVAAVESVLAGNMAVDAEIFYAYNPNAQDGSWHEKSATFVCQIGSLKFFA